MRQSVAEMYNPCESISNQNPYERIYQIDYQILISLKGTYRYKKCPISGQSAVLNGNYVFFKALSL